ncbi:hypothetical protein RND71_035906 [Anisodus tanguticus]|uniref:Uncharacterized protein n=1 Tax=Anisodus tanguticus TaxID=243964 RepID=A0AAE1V2L3_9SOLA|nr:hypothetical protein RND71_035906 [Anisodus tanguticus]
MTKLETLKLDNNMLSGETTSWLFNMKALKNLFLGRNALKWNNNAKIVPQCMLSGLSLQSCGLVGLIPGWISSQRSLDYLDLSKNQLEGIFPQWLADMELGTVILSDNNLTGSLPPSLFHSRSLSLLDLSRNRFSGELPENMGNATAIMILILAENSFSGKFRAPSPIFIACYCWTCQRTNFLAQFLILIFMTTESQENSQTFISEISTLRSLNLRNNSLQGSVPCSISNLSNLQILDLSHNSFTGSIPAEVGDLVGMIETPITFSSISFIFTFSIEYTVLIVNWKRSVQVLSSSASINIYSWLDLSKNHLSGEIPSSLGKLRPQDA